MKLVSSDGGMKEIDVNGKRLKRQKDGTFHVSGPEAHMLKKTGDFAVAGITFTGATGYRCQDCNFLSLYRDRCGQCGGTDLVKEED